MAVYYLIFSSFSQATLIDFFFILSYILSKYKVL